MMFEAGVCKNCGKEIKRKVGAHYWAHVNTSFRGCQQTWAEPAHTGVPKVKNFYVITTEGVTNLYATLTDGSEHQLHNWYADEKDEGIYGRPEWVGKSLAEVRGLVYEEAIRLINNWVD